MDPRTFKAPRPDMPRQADATGDVGAPPAAAPLSLADELAADENRVVEITDAIGRRIGVRKVRPTDSLRMARIFGEDAKNEAVMVQVMGAIAVVSIDGETVPMPTNLVGIEQLMNRLGFHGIQAAMIATTKFKTPMLNLEEAIKNL